MKTIEVEEAVARMFGVRQNLIVPNICWGLWIHECDLLVVTQSGYVTEVEIKTSRADLRKDFEKAHNHDDRQNRIKCLYYAVPESMAEYALGIVPVSAGIIKVRYKHKDEHHYKGELSTKAKIIREAPKRKSRPLTSDEMYQVARLGCMRIWGLKVKLIKAGEIGA